MSIQSMAFDFMYYNNNWHYGHSYEFDFHNVTEDTITK